MDSLFDHHSFLCSSFLGKILDDKEHKLHHSLPPRHSPNYNFRQSRMFDLRKMGQNKDRPQLRFVINVLKNKTIILLTLAEYSLILANSAYGIVD